MVKLPLRPWRKPPPILVFMLAVILPAAALVISSVVYLRRMQRDKVIEAVYQREYQQTLAIAEKRINERAFEVAGKAVKQFPNADQPDQLDNFLTTHPDITHAFIWTEKGHMAFRSRPERMAKLDFQAENKKLSSEFDAEFAIESEEMMAKVKAAAKDGRHFYIFNEPVARGDRLLYESFVILIPRGWNPDHPALAGFTYDEDYLKGELFPQALNEVLPYQNPGDTSHPHLAMMIRKAKDDHPLAASMCWDGGTPEVERPLYAVFSGLVLGIRPEGTTMADISNRWTRLAFMILGALSLLMGVGMILAYRNVASELALAKLKSDFVSNVSHELRTPLALIRLYAETLELGRISNAGKHQQYYEIIRKESERLTSLINNILDFSRIEAGKKEYSFCETDVADLVRNTLESYRFEIEQNGFQFEQKIDNNLPPLRVDREAIARSLLNPVRLERFLRLRLCGRFGTCRRTS